MREMRLEDVIEGNCYHVCTDGQESPIIMKDVEDYRTAHNYLAISAWKCGITILAYCIMSNHIHVAVICRDRETAERFIRMFKRLYSLYLNRKYGSRQQMHGTADSISLIDSMQYLKNCIAYILRNPVCAKICGKVEDYRWSSHTCYFNRAKDTSKPVSQFSIRNLRKILMTRADLSDCPFHINQEGYIADSSFVRNDIVEKIFQNSGRAFLFYLGTCNDAKMEYDMACKPLLRVNDTELSGIAESLASSRFNGKSISELSTQSRCLLIKNLFFNNKTSIPQLSRILGISRELVSKILRS